mmetsp:Transcript_16652/g.28643  ORF Transcript_16652/g.28643 Transcript_16652/m.28643 type:complete len:386 (+) Transcript_16652:91-1248(+)
MPAPSIFAVIRHVISRALRETGQALDRAGIRGVVHANQGRRLGIDDPYWFNDHLSRHRGIMSLLRRGEPMVPGLTAGNMNTTQIVGGSEVGVAFLAPCATLIGNVQVAPNTSIFYKAILKADVAAYGVNTIRTAKEEEHWKSLPVGGYERKKDAGMLDAGSGINHPTFGGANGGGIYIGEGTNIQDACMVTSYEGHTTIGKYVTVGHSAHIHSASVGDESLIGMGAILKPGSVVESQSFVAAGAVVDRGTIVKGGEIWGGNPAKKLRDLTAEEKGRLRMQAEKYIDVGKSHNHVMELGGNVPDYFIDDELLGMGSHSEVDSRPEAMKLIPNSEEESGHAKELNGAKINGDPALVSSNDQNRQHEKELKGQNEEMELTMNKFSRQQ